MNLFRALVIGIMVLAPSLPAAAASGETNAPAGFSPGQVMATWGWIVAQQENVAGIEINPSEQAVFLKGFASGIHGQPAPGELWKAAPDLDRLGKARREKITRAVERKNEAEAKSFFDDLKKDTNVFPLPGGVFGRIRHVGQGGSPRSRQTVIVNYVAHLPDGTEFGQAGPLEMVLVTNHAPCRGWVEALEKMNRGGAMELYVPPPLPEAEAFRWGIAPGSAMVFRIELLDVRDSREQELADALVLPAPEPDLPASGYSESRLLELWGWSVAQKTRAAQFGLSEEQLSALTQGMRTGLAGGSSPVESPGVVPAVEEFVNEQRDRVRRAEKQKRLAETEKLFAGLKQNTNIVESPSGLRYEILQAGSGAHPQMDQFVKVNYVGRLIDGRIFDRTDPTLGPLDIKVGTVIAGWNEGVQKIGKSGKIKLYIPPELGYGGVATGGIPADSMLIFEIELLDIRDTLEETRDGVR